jgi:hypothetical protein
MTSKKKATTMTMTKAKAGIAPGLGVVVMMVG